MNRKEPQKVDVFLKYGDTIGKDLPLEGIEYGDKVYTLVHPTLLAKFEDKKND